jgi:tetratricopeptide (TPR) repeat protein
MFMGKEQEAWKDVFSEAVKLHMQGVEGDKEAAQKAYQLMEKVRELASNNNLVEAYYGSASTLLARDIVDPMEKLKKATRGLKILDISVSKEPDNTEIRILRAYVCSRIPENFFHRSVLAIEDFNYLLGRYEKVPSIFSKQMYWKILYELGQAYKNVGKIQEARKTWEKLLSDTTDAKYRGLLKEEGLPKE